MTEKETPGAGIAVVAAAQQASAQVKLSSRQHDAPATRLVCCPDMKRGSTRTHQVFEPLFELLAVVALGNAVLYPPALSKI